MQFCLPEWRLLLIRFLSIISKRGSHRASIFFMLKMLCLMLNKLPYYISVPVLIYFDRSDRSALPVLVRSTPSTVLSVGNFVVFILAPAYTSICRGLEYLPKVRYRS